MIVRIGNGAGFLGDNLDAPRRLAETGKLDYLTLEYLAELTLSILARKREKDPDAGYAEDFLTVLASLVLSLKAQPNLKIVTNAGGMNPIACARRAASILVDAKMADVAIGVVTGDDLFPRLNDLRTSDCDFKNLDTGLPLRELKQPIVSANAYLGARPIAQCLADGARIVITGRVADASLTVGPAMHEFGWAWDDWNHLAGASVAGHLIECGAQTTGAFYPHWQEIDLANVGYPIAELDDNGDCVITKPANTGGRVNRETVCEQLMYEIGDPAHYLTPDVDVDFTTVEVEEIGVDRVRVSGATGRKAPDDYKVSLAYRDGFMASGQLLVYGRDCVAKAQECAKIIWARLHDAGYDYADKYSELLGSGDGVPGLASSRAINPPEVMLRMAVHDPRQDACERFTREFAPLATAGPAGLAGYTAARGTLRPVFAYWPTLVPRNSVEERHETRPARAWME
ncbi:MAG TPA: acyclic terpene utilization AtuA family protein [Pirellulales bacterium]|nr:acyclic terpene utilization AtuA family protein [Pirellulales bacterium]